MGKAKKFDRLAREVIDLALEFRKAGLWRLVDSDDPIRIWTEEGSEELLSFVLGSEGQELGLGILCGDRALTAFEEHVLLGQMDGVEAVATLLILHFVPRSTVEPELLRLHAAADRKFSRDASVPIFVTVDEVDGNRPMRRGHLRSMALSMRAILLAHRQGVLRPRPWDDRRRMLALRIEGKGRHAHVIDQVVACPRTGEWIPDPVVVDQRWYEDTRELERLEGGWILGTLLVPLAPAGGPLHAVVVVVDEVSELLLCTKVFPVGEQAKLAGILRELFTGPGEVGPESGDPSFRPGLPTRIVFAESALAGSFESVLAELGIQTVVDPGNDLLQDCLGSVMDRLETLGELAEQQRFEMADPETADFNTWKAADTALSQLLITESGGAEILGRKQPLKRYFGDAGGGLDLIKGDSSGTLGVAFLDWYMLEYRVRHGTRSKAEMLRDKKHMAPILRILLEARIASGVSFVRVVSLDPGASIEVENMQTGTRTTIHDVGLSQSTLAGIGLFLRISPVGKWNFCSIAGPPIASMRMGWVLDVMENLGLQSKGEVTGGQSYLFGRIWMELDAQPAPILQNTDGDPLEELLARFRVGDEPALRRHLDGMLALEAEDDFHWSWILPRLGDAIFKNGVRVARLELIGSELLVNVNSRKRLSKVRDALKGARGLSYEGAGEPPPAELSDSGAQPECSAEMAEEITRELRRMHLVWLDESLPALDGLTPREAYLLPRWKNKVVKMVRTYPDSMGPSGPISPPRDEMLAELRRGK